MSNAPARSSDRNDRNVDRVSGRPIDPSTGRPPRSRGPRTKPFRSGGPSRTSRRNDRPAARPARSPLADALDAAAAAPAPEDREFGQFGLPPALVTTLARRGMLAPFAIQTRVLPDALAGKDILGRAQTGSGKTLAFGLPVLARLVQDAPARRTPSAPRALILVPTRELAKQVDDALAPLAHGLDLRVSTVVGGLSIPKQIDALRRGVDILVATPGRLIDLMERRSCDLSRIEITVLDEADHMADLGFLPAVKQILDATPNDAQRLLLSATLDGGVDTLVTTYLTDPAFHAVAPSFNAAHSMEHKVFILNNSDKVAIAGEIAARPARTLFFVRTKHGADRLAKQLSREGTDAGAIHGNLNQNQRQRALDAFQSGRTRVLVATDVAARGIHVDDVDLVVHYDLPADHKDYLHRSGRTARAGNTGTVVAFADPSQQREVGRLHRDADVTATNDRVHVGHEAVRELATSGEPIVVTEKAPSERPPRDRGPRRPRQGGGFRSEGGGFRSEGGPRREGAGAPRQGGPRREGSAPRQGGSSTGGPRRSGSYQAAPRPRG